MKNQHNSNLVLFIFGVYSSVLNMKKKVLMNNLKERYANFLIVVNYVSYPFHYSIKKVERR